MDGYIQIDRLCPFRYQYRIPVSITVTVSSTVRVLNSTRYLQYSIPTSMCRISVSRCRYWVPISIPDTGRGLDNDIGYRYPMSEEIPSSCQEKEPFEAKAAKKKNDYEKLMVAYNSFLVLSPCGGKRETEPWGNPFAACLVSSSHGFFPSAHILLQLRHIERGSREFRLISMPPGDSRNTTCQ